MMYTVFIYEGDQPVSSESFKTIQEAFTHMGKLDLTTDVRRCILDNGTRILFDLSRDEDGNLS